MKAKYALFIFGLGYCLEFIGALMKILHTYHADSILVVATILKVLGALLLIYKVSNYPKFKEFLNQ
jgi:hypothetical protein